MQIRKILLCCFFVLVLPIISAMPDTQTSETAKTCCFERAGYQGICHVTPAEDETCGSILKYLNTPGTVGKDYCGASKLRGGWTAVDCPKE